MSKKVVKKPAKKRRKKPKISQASRIWTKFCGLSMLDKYYLVYDNCGLYDDFRARMEDAIYDKDSDETLDSLEEEIDSLQKDHK